MKTLEDLRWEPHWVTHLGCLKGCLNYLGRDVSDAWLYGVCGHAFVINVAPTLCPSGPTNWNPERVIRLAENLGIKIETVHGWRGHDDLDTLRSNAWTLVRSAIDSGYPCYGWELAVPEYYVIYGYDDDGYYASGPTCDDGKGPIPWERLGTSEIGVVEVRSVQTAEPAGDRTAVREALSFAIEYADDASPWTEPTSFGGMKAYDGWMNMLREGEASHFGHAYNATIWYECRSNVSPFLNEASKRLQITSLKRLFKEAANHYENVADQFRKITSAHPFALDNEMKPMPASDATRRIAETLRSARDAEQTGLQILQMIVDCLE